MLHPATHLIAKATPALLRGGLALALLGVPVPAAAQPVAARVGDGLYERARELYQQGRGKFDTADYVAAVELWTEAYTALPTSADYVTIKVLLLYDIATAQERAYEVDHEPSHLRQARILLESFEASIGEIYASAVDAEAERTRVRERLARLDAKLESHGAAAAPGNPPPPAAEPAQHRSADRGPTAARGRGQRVAGAVLLGAGGAGLGLMAAGLAMGRAANDVSGLDPDDLDARREQFDRGRTGNALAWAGGVAGGAALVVGTVLLGTGMHARARRLAWAPVGGRDMAGFTLRGRF
jgi:hypothetical protein